MQSGQGWCDGNVDLPRKALSATYPFLRLTRGPSIFNYDSLRVKLEGLNVKGQRLKNILENVIIGINSVTNIFNKISLKFNYISLNMFLQSLYRL